MCELPETPISFSKSILRSVGPDIVLEWTVVWGHNHVLQHFFFRTGTEFFLLQNTHVRTVSRQYFHWQFGDIFKCVQLILAFSISAWGRAIRKMACFSTQKTTRQLTLALLCRSQTERNVSIFRQTGEGEWNYKSVTCRTSDFEEAEWGKLFIFYAAIETS